MQLIVPGSVYAFALSPDATEIATDADWPEPVLRDHGKGYQAVYTVEPAMRDEILAWVEKCADGIVGFSDADRDARRAKAWVRKARSE